MTKVCLDCSLLAHALIGTQQTEDARLALAELVAGDNEILLTPALFLEFSSLVLKLRNGRRIVEADALALYADITTLSADVVPFSLPLFDRAWQVARDLGQSDTFDALGYAAAELTGGEFWTSDRRFANAAEARSLPGIVYVP